ncbi:MAG: tRNA dihydrouridine synthase DusB [Verrucomicrobia bacterium]|nr:tRNA dihydrouridine synthase DusB [Verrucomicrobiota bacterium]
MTFLKRPFTFGNITLPSNIFCAPLAGCSDLPFRRMTTQHQPGLIYCEMVKMDALVRHDPNTFRLLDYETHMHPIGAQICGSKPQIAGQCAKIVEDLGFDVVDLNCGCPVDKVTKDGSGSGMLKNPELIGEILANMVAAVKIPVTVKIRAGWDEKSIIAEQVTQIAEQAGAKAICIHGRTRAQGYQGFANWDHIRRCKQIAKSIVVIGNGDVFDAPSAKRMFEETLCDAVLVSRGTMGQPWIVDDIYRLLSGEEIPERDGHFYRDVLLQHLDHIASYQNERRAAMDLRRVGCWYLKKGKGTRKLREVLNKSKSVVEIRQLICDYPWQETDFSSAIAPEPDMAETC